MCRQAVSEILSSRRADHVCRSNKHRTWQAPKAQSLSLHAGTRVAKVQQSVRRSLDRRTRLRIDPAGVSSAIELPDQAAKEF